MTKTPPIPKDKRPEAIERLLREYRRDYPGSWMPWADVLAEVGGSELDFTKMMRAAKKKILADEMMLSAAPEMPDDMREDFERFTLGLWKRACDLADVSASELRRARQIDRDAMEHERVENDEMIATIVKERDDLRTELDRAQKESEHLSTCLSETRAELRDARAALDEVRNLFAGLTGKQAGTTDAAEKRGDDAKPQARRKSGAKTPSQERDLSADQNQPPDEPFTPEFPMS